MNEYATAFLVPSTTRNRNWEDIEETYLCNTLFRTLDQHCPDSDISVFVGYDSDDPILSDQGNRFKLNTIFKNFEIIWVECEPDHGNVVGVWNKLCKKAMEAGFEWFMVLGDDIRLPNDPSWLKVFQKQLKKQNYIGWAAGYSNNDKIATQFLIHRTHWNIFEFVFPPQIRNYFCDDFMNEIYPKRYRYWRQDFPLYNTGGQPRYIPNNDRKLCQFLLRRHKKGLNEFLNSIEKIKR
tara:strand:- start:271 stop:981 length:711 start_codon:yes stop_codon:yes gene_type:complete